MSQSSSSRSPAPNDHDLAFNFDMFFKAFKLERKILSQETINLIHSCLMIGNLQTAVDIITEALREIENAPLSIAVTGETGSGKSSFINALRGIGHEGEGAAPTGVVETTMERLPYKHPKFPNVTFWDLPGIGSTTFTPETYLKKLNFGEYDFFIITSDTRFRENDAQLAKAIGKTGKNFYFVRTKVDNDIHNERRSKPQTFDQERILQMIRKKCQGKLQEDNVSHPRVFLVSNIDVSDYDFPNLEMTLLRELPAQKRHIFMLSLPSVTEAAIDLKRDSLRQKVWLEALKAGFLATIPFVGVISDLEKLEETLTLYRSYFGLDDASLEIMAKDLHVSVEKLKSHIKSPHLLSVEKDKDSLTKKLLKCIEMVLSAMGGPLATGLYFSKTFYLQNCFLDTVASDAKALLKKELFTEKTSLS
ncbi:T-cell-specific guanine nucleotide triphosphate-binding protein 2-like [Manis javanica]|uniref:T-cell-specific guanine nucleotide triphosphate-binding protein 2-like n=1 Tax=Manis javanica TaxID=9974 RepID=UPI000813B664|nr:T-cell-specific guanine nucleotide triphosphate-binding protein 2-like [Manis javanica]XP_036857907.1 T-cell-specific guanine nucleotide triphosphate-binding protein 2-like [Manis javanica]XP_036857908.1 T-cell-specific guanine nucleotide triphosphate-binding protein 2-like [Manis javanica]